eukprot:scaffold421724_cov28-Prasinocladus_malaysianus.AAC.1
MKRQLHSSLLLLALLLMTVLPCLVSGQTSRDDLLREALLVCDDGKHQPNHIIILNQSLVGKLPEEELNNYASTCK